MFTTWVLEIGSIEIAEEAIGDFRGSKELISEDSRAADGEWAEVWFDMLVSWDWGSVSLDWFKARSDKAASVLLSDATKLCDPEN